MDCPPPPQALHGHTTHLVGKEPIPLVLLGGRAVHPLEGCILDEDGQCSEDEGCKQVQVDVVSGTVQVSAGESRARPGTMADTSAPQPPVLRPKHTSGMCPALGPCSCLSSSGCPSFL